MFSLNAFENFNYHNHNAILRKVPKNKTPIKILYPRTVKHLAMLAKSNGRARGLPAHLREILRTTSDAEEQFALLKHYYNCMGIKVKVKTRNYNKLTEHEEALIVQYYRAGYSISKIARALGRHVSTVYYALKRLL